MLKLCQNSQAWMYKVGFLDLWLKFPDQSNLNYSDLRVFRYQGNKILVLPSQYAGSSYVLINSER